MNEVDKMEEKYQYYDGTAVRLSSELLVVPNQIITLNGSEPYYDYVVECRRFKLCGKSMTEENSKDWYNELEALPKIGKKTAKKIARLYPTREILVKNLDSLPFDDDECEVLIKTYRGGN